MLLNPAQLLTGDPPNSMILPTEYSILMYLYLGAEFGVEPLTPERSGGAATDKDNLSAAAPLLCSPFPAPSPYDPTSGSPFDNVP